MQEKAKSIAKALLKYNAQLAVAESCTGGRLAASFTALPGASQWFSGGIVVYTREAKQNVLGLTDTDLQDGLVSQRCAEAMVRLVARQFGTDYAIATTGVCEASSESFCACTAWIAVQTPMGVRAFPFRAKDKGRAENMDMVVNAAVDFLYRFITEL